MKKKNKKIAKSEKKRLRRNKRYFFNINHFFIFIALASSVLVYLFEFEIIYKVLGPVVFILLLILNFKIQPSKKEINSYFEKEKKKIIREIAKKLDLSPYPATFNRGLQMDYLEESGYLFEPINNKLMVKKKFFGEKISSNYYLVLFVFTKKQVFRYYITFSCINRYSFEVYDEHFYKDIVNIESRKVIKDNERSLINVLLILKEGEKIDLNLSYSLELEKFLDAMRNRIREHN